MLIFFRLKSTHAPFLPPSFLPVLLVIASYPDIHLPLTFPASSVFVASLVWVSVIFLFPSLVMLSLLFFFFFSFLFILFTVLTLSTSLTSIKLSSDSQSPLLSVTVGNRCHGSSRAGPADQSGGSGSVGGGARQAAASRRLCVRPSEGDLLFSPRGHDPAHPYAQHASGRRSAHTHTG